MENTLSNSQDEGPNVAPPSSSSSSSSSATLLQAQKSSGLAHPEKPAADVAAPMVPVDSPETNNNLKIFKSEYDTKPSAMTNQNNGVIEHQQQHQWPRQQLVVECNMSHNVSGADALQAASENNLTDSLASQKSASGSPAAAGASTTASIGPAQDQNGEPEEHQQQQVPSSAASKLPTNNRSILILREIQPDTPESSVREIFNSENCFSRPVHCEYALHNSWYVTFPSDEDAKLALAYIRKHIVRWQGKPIMARYKPKPAVPSAADEPQSASMHTHHHHNHPHHQEHPHIVPSMVTQQQHNHYQNGAPEGTGLVPSPSFVGGVPSSAATSVDGDSAPSHLSTAHGHSHHDHVQQHPPMVMSPTDMAGHTSGPLSSHNDSSGLMPPHYGVHGPQQPTPPHHHQSDGSMLHHPHHHLAQMMGPLQQQAHHHHHHTMASSYGSPYYDQHGQLVQHAPWDLSSVFIYNGLSPYNKTSVSGVALVGGAYHQPPGQHQHQHQAHLNNQQHHQHHYPPHQRHHQRQNANHNQGPSQHSNHNHSNHLGNTANVGSNQHMFGGASHHQGTKSSRKNNKQSNK